MDIHPIFSGRKIHFSRNDTGSSEHALEKKKFFNLNFTHYTKLNSKRVTDLNVTFQIIRLRGGGNQEENLWGLGIGIDFFDLTVKAKSIKRNIGKLDLLC